MRVAHYLDLTELPVQTTWDSLSVSIICCCVCSVLSYFLMYKGTDIGNSSDINHVSLRRLMFHTFEHHWPLRLPLLFRSCSLFGFMSPPAASGSQFCSEQQVWEETAFSTNKAIPLTGAQTLVRDPEGVTDVSGCFLECVSPCSSANNANTEYWISLKY